MLQVLPTLCASPPSSQPASPMYTGWISLASSDGDRRGGNACVRESVWGKSVQKQTKERKRRLRFIFLIEPSFFAPPFCDYKSSRPEHAHTRAQKMDRGYALSTCLTRLGIKLIKHE